jgi:predicted negative regulator of RcsB-dependent stress response
MMYETEEQQVEALKKWWKDNGKSIIAGVVLGLGGVLGWKAWVDYRDRVAAEASNVFDQLVSAVDADNKEVAEAQARLLHQNFDSTPYSAFANLMQARLRYQQGDTTGTKEALEQAIAKAPEPALKVIAVLRLAGYISRRTSWMLPSQCSTETRPPRRSRPSTPSCGVTSPVPGVMWRRLGRPTRRRSRAESATRTWSN